jgi:hypothetical protein
MKELFPSAGLDRFWGPGVYDDLILRRDALPAHANSRAMRANKRRVLSCAGLVGYPSRQATAWHGNGHIAPIGVRRFNQPEGQLGLLVIDAVSLNQGFVQPHRESVHSQLLPSFIVAYRGHVE